MYEDNEFTYSPKVKKLLAEAKKNKEQRTSSQSGMGYFIPQPGRIYPAVITDAECREEEEEIWLYRSVFKSSSIFSSKIEKFKMNGGNSFIYDEICATLGTDGNPVDLIGKFVAIHIERNGDFQNLKVDAEIDEDEFREMINNLGSKNTKKKPVHKKRTSQRTADEKKSARKARKKTVEHGRLEDLEPDVDYADEYDDRDYADEYDDRDYADEYDGNYADEYDDRDYTDEYDGDYADECDDRNAEQEYLDDMADFQG